MAHTINGDNVIFQAGGVSYVIGTVSKVETFRLDAETVEDIALQFDLEQDRYIELSRVTRNETAPLSENEQLKKQVADLTVLVGDLILNGGL